MSIQPSGSSSSSSSSCNPCSDALCSICLNEILSNSTLEIDKTIQTLCGHLFHEFCINQWTATDSAQNRCPNCREPMFSTSLPSNNNTANQVAVLHQTLLISASSGGGSPPPDPFISQLKAFENIAKQFSMQRDLEINKFQDERFLEESKGRRDKTMAEILKFAGSLKNEIIFKKENIENLVVNKENLSLTFCDSLLKNENCIDDHVKNLTITESPTPSQLVQTQPASFLTLLFSYLPWGNRS